ncbi:MAG: Adenylate cyclase [Planctomycetaceae bacterium]|nr:Adenylate cyclase [Planctomycetaceae bacterium]
MQHAFRVTIFDGTQQVFEQEILGAIELGRQRKEEAGPFFTQQLADGTRIVVAELAETTVSRQQVRIDYRAEGNFTIKNIGTSGPIQLRPQRVLDPGNSWVCVGTAKIQLGSRLVNVELVPVIGDDDEDDDDADNVQGLSATTAMPGGSFGFDSSVLRAVRTAELANQLEPVIRSLQAAIDVFQSAQSSRDFFHRAVQAVVDLVGLDSGRVLLWKNSRFELVAARTAEQFEDRTTLPISNSVLKKVRDQKRTLWQLGSNDDMTASLVNVQSVVASPIMNATGELIGVLYGDRGYGALTADRKITKLEAMLVELLACSVASGLMRIQHEEALQTQRLRFEQFQSKKLAEQLECQPDLLKGREVEVSVLFVDIRRFSKISEQLGAATTFEWINDVMSELSECVNETDGIIVDFVGDEIMAMWGAPDNQPHHADQACRTALKMLNKVPLINAKWNTILPEPFAIGIGLNSGPARAGNVGSHRKFKYGPLGNTVNVASRMQGCTKHLRCPCIISEATRSLLKEEWFLRRLCEVRVVNINQPVALFELTTGMSANWGPLREHYESALQAFHNKDFRKSAALLGDLLEKYPDDGPSLVLMNRAVQALLDGLENFDPVWNLPGK